MSEIKIIGSALPDMPWQDKPSDCMAPVWRYSENPIINRNPLPDVARIFNSAVAPYGDGYIGVFRGEQRNGVPHIYLGRSKDAIHWGFDHEKIPFTDENGEPFMPPYAYDPRLVKIDGVYYIMWCQDAFGPTIGMAKTTDFKTFTRLEEDGSYTITNCCAVAGLGGDSKRYRDGSFEYYISEPIIENDPKSVGSFILAAIEYEKMTDK